MTAVVILILQVMSCLGWGAAVLAVLGLDRRLGAGERAVLAFAIGVGLLGWLVFWLGIAGGIGPAFLITLLVLGLPGLGRLVQGWDFSVFSKPAPVLMGLSALCVLHVAYQGAQVLSPPVDADTLAYHYDLPKRFVQAGRIFFVPRAVDGAVPLLVQVTYIPLLALGGERAMQFWAVVTTWGVAALMWVWLHPLVGRVWALAAALLFIGTPAVLYGAGTGQVEVRLALFATLSLFALHRWRREPDWRWLALTGLSCGFFMAGKYTGLLFAAAVGLVVLGSVLLTHRQRWPDIVVFAIVAMVAGGQWYGWNWHNSGDPVFPMLYGLLGGERVRYWSAEAAQHFHQTFLDVETPLGRGVGGLLAYPWLATFAPLPAFEAGRTGFGIAPWLLFPFAALGGVALRRRILGSPWLLVLAALIAFYVLWFFLGGSQRIRHLVPVLPALLAILVIGTKHWCCFPGRRQVTAVALAAVLAIQAMGGAVTARWYVVAWDKPRNEYYQAVLGAFPVARWANAHLGPDALLLNPYRDINYLLDIPNYHAHSVDQALVDLTQRRFDPAKLWRESRALGITHAVFSPGDNMLWHMANAWIKSGCGDQVATLHGSQASSRSLGGAATFTEFAIVRLTPESCQTNLLAQAKAL